MPQGPDRTVLPLSSPGSLATNRREQRGWYFYDWANSAFATTVLTVFLGPYLTTVAKTAADAAGFVRPLGVPVAAGSFFPYLVSASGLLQILVLPLLGALADFSHQKKGMMAVFAYAGAFATMGMFFIQAGAYLLGGALFLVASVSFSASVVLYNSFLSEIATPEERDRVSSIGWATGYLGGGVLLALNLVLFSRAVDFGLTAGQAVRINLSSAGLWWAIFTVIPLAMLKNRWPTKRLEVAGDYLTTGFRQLARTLRGMANRPQTLLFLAAYLVYDDAIQTVIALSTQFGQEELGIPISTLSAIILMVQFVAFFGALLFGRGARALGAKTAIMISLVVWTLSLFYGYAFLHDALQFAVLSGVIGVVLGGSQALSRSVFSQMIPRGAEAEYFSIYEISERGTSFISPLFFGLVLQFSGSYRFALLSVALFFLVGLALLSRVDVQKAAIEARG